MPINDNLKKIMVKIGKAVEKGVAQNMMKELW